jgi:hypothetical protein
MAAGFPGRVVDGHSYKVPQHDNSPPRQYVIKNMLNWL